MVRFPGTTIFAVLLALIALTPGAAQGKIVLKTEFQDTQPKFIRGPDGEFSGLCVEIMNLVGKESGFQFTYPPGFVPISRITGDLAQGDIDIYFGLVKAPEREGLIKYVGELFSTRYQLLARSQDPAAGFTSVDQVRDSRIPIMLIRGTGPSLYFRGIPGLVYDEAPTSVENALRQVKAGNGRLFGYYDLGLTWFLSQPEYGSSLTALKIPFSLDVQWMCVRKDLSPETVEKLARALVEVKKSPEWAGLMKQYFSGRF